MDKGAVADPGAFAVGYGRGVSREVATHEAEVQKELVWVGEVQLRSEDRREQFVRRAGEEDPRVQETVDERSLHSWQVTPFHLGI